MSANIINDYKFDKRLCFFITAYFFVQGLNLFVKLNIGDFSGWNYVTRGILLIFLLFTLKPIFYRIRVGAIVSETIMIIMLSFTIITGGASLDNYSSQFFNVIAVFMPLAISLRSVSNYKLLLDQLYIFSWPTHVLLFGVLLNVKNGSYSMAGGYALVLQLLILLDHFFAEKKIYDLIMVIIDFIVIVLFGSRGPIICIFTMVVLYLSFSHQLSHFKRVSLIIVCTVISAFLFFYRNTIIAFFISITHVFGVYSRTLEMLLNNTLVNDSGRGALTSYYCDLINQKPFIGYGLIGGWLSPDLYPHNLFVEFLLSFGVLFGPLLIGLTLIISFRAIISSNIAEQRVAHIFFAYCTSLLLSGSFTSTPEFFMLIALGLSGIKFRIKSVK